ncbi:P-loop NTPase fold protein [Rhodococcus erythropolis]|uniref:KAP family P-loop NTPase fold protein n=1 Tax=Rhodococcus erythropolis TaxID=1833 RepID=UPI000378D84C|nr:P-loop NTPase fold protein [Rhodococcus erythropolis]
MSGEPASNYLAADAPIDGENRPDLLEREWFAEQVARRISQAGAGDSVVFGFAGPWGAGKTSTLSLIRNILNNDDVPNAPWKVVEFTPWAVDNAYALAEEFYSTIASALDGKAGGKEAAAKKMLNAAAPALGAGGKALLLGLSDKLVGKGTTQDAINAMAEQVADSAGDFTFDEDPFSRRFTQISRFLEDLKLRVLVIVDDVDRLHHDELLAVMKAVRLLGRFKGVHYLLSYDTQTVTDVLTRSDLANGNRRRAEQYLEKIVQYPFQLPPIQDVHLANVIEHRLRELTQRGGYDPVLTELHLEVLLAQLPLDQLTLRTVHRLFAQVDMLLALITEKGSTAQSCDEIDLLDAILVTYVRLEHHDLYRQLVTWKSDLTYQTGASFDVDKDRARAMALREKIEKTVDPNGENHSETQRGLAVLRALFPDAVSRVNEIYTALPQEAPFQVRKATYFDRYFAFGFPAKDIRDGEIRADLVDLIESGRLSPDSTISAYAHNGKRRPLLHTKLRSTIGAAVEQATDLSNCGAAAISLTYLTTAEERREPHLNAWWAAATFQLWEALESHLGPGAARKAVSDYLDEYGAGMSAIAIHVGHLSPQPQLQDAAEIVWDSIRNEIVETLLDNRPNMSDPNPVHRYTYWIDYPPLLLSQRIQLSLERHKPNPDDLDLIGIAARLVDVKTDRGSNQALLLYPDIDLLMKFVPHANWPTGQLPTQTYPDIDRTDISYENRRKLAANAIQERLAMLT